MSRGFPQRCSASSISRERSMKMGFSCWALERRMGLNDDSGAPTSNTPAYNHLLISSFHFFSPFIVPLSVSFFLLLLFLLPSFLPSFLPYSSFNCDCFVSLFVPSSPLLSSLNLFSLPFSFSSIHPSCPFTWRSSFLSFFQLVLPPLLSSCIFPPVFASVRLSSLRF